MIQRILTCLALTAALPACASNGFYDLAPSRDNADEAIAMAQDHQGSLALSLGTGERMMMNQPYRDADTICGTVYDRSSNTGDTRPRNECVDLAEVQQIRVFGSRVSLEGAANNVGALALFPLYGLILLGCVTGDCDPEN
ncbi:hypothetical protein [Maricaulis sp.]|uniref:hypothetical protein n=1 Tax=Maricaulis sp. TaxID=1486257 RepID=UPI0025C701DD|nr:hypothetical protein [Maricaulis sp.]